LVLLVERELGFYEFPHLSFQGYFAASYLAQRSSEEAIAQIRENWDKPWWRAAILNSNFDSRSK
jgi:predicted NACHT family NTPase